MRVLLITFTISILVTISIAQSDIDIDPYGYIAYCPCMGRFGNQADHFLGALSFAKSLGRTLILPPWIEYVFPDSVRVPFDSYFKVEPLQQYHRVITMETFMQQLAPVIWPPGNRIDFCYSSRHHGGQTNNKCPSKEGNPFGPFWDHFEINFDKSEFFADKLLSYDVHENVVMASRWNKLYPPDKYPVLAFSGAPGAFPVLEKNRNLHKFLQWNDRINDLADAFINDVLPKGSFVGIHLRNNRDWDAVCKHVIDEKGYHNSHLFASPQCLGYNFERGRLTKEICEPGIDTIMNQIKDVVIKNHAKSVFVASEYEHMIDEINSFLKDLNVKAYKQQVDDPHVSLAILAKSTHYIGNCVSSFSAFAARERYVKGLPNSFWGYLFKVKKSEL